MATHSKGNMKDIIIAAVSGSGIFKSLITIIGVGLVAWVLWWLIDYLKLPEPINKIARALVAIAVVVFLIDVILKITGSGGFISW